MDLEHGQPLSTMNILFVQMEKLYYVEQTAKREFGDMLLSCIVNVRPQCTITRRKKKKHVETFDYILKKHKKLHFYVSSTAAPYFIDTCFHLFVSFAVRCGT